MWWFHTPHGFVIIFKPRLIPNDPLHYKKQWSTYYRSLCLTSSSTNAIKYLCQRVKGILTALCETPSWPYPLLNICICRNPQSGKLSQLSQMLHKIRSGQPPRAMPASWHTTEEVCLHHLSKEIHLSGNLKVHFTIHTGERRYACTICSKRFIRQATWSHTWEFTHERDGTLVPFVQRDSPMGVP